MTINSKPSSGEEIVIQTQTQLGDKKLIATDSFDRFLEDLAKLGQDLETLKLGDVFSKSKSSASGAESLGLLSLISNKNKACTPEGVNLNFGGRKVRVKELNDRTIEAGETALTTNGDEFITGINTAPAIVTLNDFPADGEVVAVSRAEASIKVLGTMVNGTSLTIFLKGNTADFRYSLAALAWLIT